MGPEPNAPSNMLQGPQGRPPVQSNHLAAVTDYLASRGRFGDKIIAHISVPEANLLARLGGASTINPSTGLLEFYADQSGGYGGPGPSGGGFGGEGGSGPGVSGPDHGGNQGGGGTPAPMAGSSGGWNSLSQLAVKDPITSTALARQRDYANVGNSALDNFGNFLARALGFNEIDPTASNLAALAAGRVPSSTSADWGFDPAGLIGGAIGTGLGIPGLGLAADLISQAMGRPLESNLGPDVFGNGGVFGSGQMAGAPTAPGTAGPSAPGYGGVAMSGGVPVGGRGNAGWGPGGGGYLAMAGAPMVGSTQVAANPWTPPWMGNGGAMNMLAALRQSYT